MRRIFLACIFIAPFCQAEAQGEHLFASDVLHEVRLVSLQKSDWDSITARYEREIYTPMQVVIDGVLLDSVGVRIKGNNFLNNLDKGKFQAYKLDFNAFVKGQEYDGLKKINLNNREKLANHLAYRLCLENGIIGPRTSFSKVYFDDVLVGNYLNLEQIDKTFLKQHYGNSDGNLYSASGKGAILEYMGPNKEDYYYAYEKKSNETKNDYTDLLDLLWFISNSTDRLFADSINLHLDFKPFLMSVVIEMTVCKRDAFYDAGRNFYLYHDPASSRFVYIPDDFDYSFSDEFRFDLNFQNDQSPHLGDVSNIILNRILHSDSLTKQYYGKVCQFIQGSFSSDSLNPYMDRMEEFEKSRDFDFEDFSMRTLDEIRDYITKRFISLETDFQAGGYICEPVSDIEAIPVTDFPLVYPNPANEIVTISFKESTVRFSLELSDLTGRKWSVNSDLTGSCTINLNHVPAGIYPLKIISGSQVRFVRIIRM
jgi:hypothetical protein